MKAKEETTPFLARVVPIFLPGCIRWPASRAGLRAALSRLPSFFGPGGQTFTIRPYFHSPGPVLCGLPEWSRSAIDVHV